MRRDLIHTPQAVDENGEAHCADCGIWLPVDVVESALGVSDGAVLDISGLGSFCPTVRGSLGREAISCSHPSAATQGREITITQCPTCGGNPTETPCPVCEGEGMVGFVDNPDDPDSPLILKVRGGSALSEGQLDAEGLSIKEAQPLSEFEKTVSRGTFANWLALRDAIRPEGVESS